MIGENNMDNITERCLRITNREHSVDGSVKYLLQTKDNESIESVFIPQKGETKFCISCQIGCVNKCAHCATGKLDYIRDLTSEEIISQVITMVEDNHEIAKKLHVLFMGMGEPFLNFKNVIQSLYLFEEINIPEEEITISTIGIIPKIYEYANMKRKSKLALSFHATTNEMRDRIIPLNKIYSLHDLIEAAHYYVNKTNNKIIIEYTIIEGFNDSLQNAIRLLEILKGLHYEVHLIPFNENSNSIFKMPSDDKVISFSDYLKKRDIECKIKRSYGTDIDGGCGQLCFKSTRK